MVTPHLLSLDSADLDVDTPPVDPTNCFVAVTATIGPSGGKGGENFAFVVATPRYLQEHGEVQWGRGMLLMNEFSWAAVRRMLQGLLAHASRPTWHEVATELNKELQWEFDNYVEYKPR